MKFLSNTHDPKDKNARMYVARRFNETPEEAWRWHRKWLKGKVIGDPQATEAYTVEQLKEMGMVGVYLPNIASSRLIEGWAKFARRVRSYFKSESPA